MTEQMPPAVLPETAAEPLVTEQPAPTVEKATKAPEPRTAPKWESDARQRVRDAVKRFSKPLSDLVARDANEGDTRLFVTDFLCYGLGYDKYADLTTEYEVKGDFADYGVRIDKDLVAFIEVKRCATKLNVRHLRQVQMYAVNEGVEWLILTNGVAWQVWHLTGGLPVALDLAFEVDLLGKETPAQKANQLFYLSREALKRRLMDDLWKAKRATSPASLAGVITSAGVLDAIRKELRRRSGQNMDAEALEALLRETVLRAECLG